MAQLLRPTWWSGRHYSFTVKTGWKALVHCPVSITVKELRITKCLPENDGYLIMSLHDLIEAHRDSFANHDAWWQFHRSCCDDFADCHYMLRKIGDNKFFDFAPLEAVFRSAMQAKGYIGTLDRFTFTSKGD